MASPGGAQLPYYPFSYAPSGLDTYTSLNLGLSPQAIEWHPVGVLIRFMKYVVYGLGQQPELLRSEMGGFASFSCEFCNSRICNQMR